VGGKHASLGELYRELAPKGIKVPNGIAITEDAYWDLQRRNKLNQRIKEILAGLDTQDSADLRQKAMRFAASQPARGSPRSCDAKS
jgi:pyruvate,water dikinase